MNDDKITLLKAIQRLDQQALIEVFEYNAPRIFRYALRLCGDPVKADDIVAEVFRKMIEALKEGNGPRKNLNAYLFQIAYHEVINEARTRGKQEDLTEKHACREEEKPEVRFENKEECDELLHAIKTVLNENQRHVITLRFLENFTVMETAKILGKNSNHIKVIQNRAIKKLRQALEQKIENNDAKEKV